MIDLSLRSIDSLRGPSAADLVFDELYRRVVELDLPPGTRLSEAEVAKLMGTSRQPVRDAFYRLSQVGLLQIQPQRSTTISRISEEAVLQARFIRTALETETVRAATEALTERNLSEMGANLAEQRIAMEADDRVRFHALDDAFHRAICACSGNEFAWGLIRINKAHMDRVRYLSLGFNTESAYGDHARILEALRARDAETGANEMRLHLSRITGILAKLQAEQPTIFAQPA